jgi:ribonuclease HI
VHLLNSANIMVVTDGGMEGGRGYFGVALAVGRTVIAQVRGVARGDPRTMCSFRAEAYGFLAGISLLVGFLQTTPTATTYTHSIHTDSASLLDRLENATSKVPVGFWLKTDSDVVIQIVETARQVPKIERKYVKGHQDGKKKKADLTQPEILNIDADKSATKMQYQMTKPAARVILFPASRANVYIQQQYICSSLPKILHASFTSDEYWKYMDEKFNWTKATRKLVAWDEYHQMLNKQTNATTTTQETDEIHKRLAPDGENCTS